MKLRNDSMPDHAKRKLLMAFREISVPRILAEERKNKSKKKLEVIK